MKVKVKAKVKVKVKVKAKAKAKRNGAQALIESLEAAGVEMVFGYPGGMVVDVFDALKDSKIKLVLGRHEQGCVHAADGYARASGKVGVAIVTSGPGLTNAITGLGAANMDGTPLILISGQVPLSQIGTDAFQEADTTGITRAVSKHGFLVHHADEIPESVAQAFYIATHGKPGAVVIDLPKNVQEDMTAARYPKKVQFRAYHPESHATAAQIARFVRLINEARRPMILAGGGVIASGAEKCVVELAEKAQIPVATTLMGLGSIDDRHPLALGMAGLHGTIVSHAVMARCDLLIALGVRFSDRVTGKVARFARGAKIVHVDCDASSIGKNVPVELGIVADVKEVIESVEVRVRSVEGRSEEWGVGVGSWSGRVSHGERGEGEKEVEVEGEVEGKVEVGEGMEPGEVIRAIDEATKERAIVVTDVGQHQMWAAQELHHWCPRRFLTSGGMGAMGFAIPAAVGAALARPKDKVVAIVGDGGAQMTFHELMVAVEHRLPITIVVMNNRSLGMVRQIQELFYKKRYSGVFMSNPDFVMMAKAFGAGGARVTNAKSLKAAVKRAVGASGPYVLEVMIDPKANVEPMAFT